MIFQYGWKSVLTMRILSGLGILETLSSFQYWMGNLKLYFRYLNFYLLSSLADFVSVVNKQGFFLSFILIDTESHNRLQLMKHYLTIYLKLSYYSSFPKYIHLSESKYIYLTIWLSIYLVYWIRKRAGTKKKHL